MNTTNNAQVHTAAANDHQNPANRITRPTITERNCSLLTALYNGNTTLCPSER